MLKTDCLIAAEMLEVAADEFSNHGCNDYDIPDTPENRSFVERMIAASEWPSEKVEAVRGRICVADYIVMRYCALLLRGWPENAEGKPQ